MTVELSFAVSSLKGNGSVFLSENTHKGYKSFKLQTESQLRGSLKISRRAALMSVQ